MHSSDHSANTSIGKGCDFDQLESLRLESDRFHEELSRLAGQVRSNRALQALVSSISVKFGQLQQGWNGHCENAFDHYQVMQRRLLDTTKSDQMSATRRVKTLETWEQEVDSKHRELRSTLTGLTTRLRADIEQTEQALEEQLLKRDMHIYEQQELLHQVDAEVGHLLDLQPEDLGQTEEFDQLMDQMQADRPSVGLNVSMEKTAGGWDSALESGSSSPEASLSPKRLKNALLVLRKLHLLNNVSDRQHPELLRQLEALLTGPDATGKLQLFLQLAKCKAPGSDLACTTPKSFHPSDQLLDKTVLSTQLFPQEAGETAQEMSQAKASNGHWEDQKTQGGALPPKGSGGQFASPRTLRLAQTLLQARAPRPAPLQESKLMYQFTKRSSTFSTKASSGLKSNMLKGTGDMGLESPSYQPGFD